MQTKDLRLQVFGALSLGQQIRMFRSIVVPYSGSSIPNHIYTFPWGYNFLLSDCEDGGTTSLRNAGTR